LCNVELSGAGESGEMLPADSMECDDISMVRDDDSMACVDDSMVAGRISADLVTFSQLPAARWKHLLNLDVIRVFACYLH